MFKIKDFRAFNFVNKQTFLKIFFCKLSSHRKYVTEENLKVVMIYKKYIKIFTKLSCFTLNKQKKKLNFKVKKICFFDVYN